MRVGTMKEWMKEVQNSQNDTSTCTINDEGNTITDDNHVLPAFCQSLEALLRRGIKRGLGVTGLVDRDYWNCIEGLTSSKRIQSKIPLEISHVIALVQHSKMVKSSTARGRLFLRVALTKGLLPQVFQCLLDNPEYVHYWYKEISPLVNFQEKKVILDVIKTLEKKTYKLNIKNCYFLNETWIIPVMEEYEFVPCAMIGVTLFSLNGKCIVIEVKEGSAAYERGICAGDCLIELYGQAIDDRWSQKVGQLKRKHQGQPVTAVFIKGRFTDGKAFAPIYQRYRLLIGQEKLTENKRIAEQPAEVANQKLPTSQQQTFEVTYVGSSDVGKTRLSSKFWEKRGNCSYVQDGITKLLKDRENIQNEEVVMQLMERDIILASKATDKVIGKFSYTETSSCALKSDDPTYFGFLAGYATTKSGFAAETESFGKEECAIIKTKDMSSTGAWIIVASCVIAVVIGLPGNTLILIVNIGRYLRHRKISTYSVLVSQLALADVIFALTLIFDVDAILNNYQWRFGLAACKTVKTAQSSSIAATATLLTVMAYEKYMGVTHTLRPRWSFRKAIFIVTATWVYVIVLTVPYSLALQVSPDGECYDADYASQTFVKSYTVFLFVTTYVVPLTCISVLHTRIVFNLKRHRADIREHAHHGGSLTPDPDSHQPKISNQSTLTVVVEITSPECLSVTRKRCFLTYAHHLQQRLRSTRYPDDRKAQRMLVAITLCFSIMTLPTQVWYLIYTFALLGANAAELYVTEVLSSMVYLHCCVNCLVYGVMDRRFRRDLQSLLRVNLGPGNSVNC